MSLSQIFGSKFRKDGKLKRPRNNKKKSATLVSGPKRKNTSSDNAKHKKYTLPQQRKEKATFAGNIKNATKDLSKVYRSNCTRRGAKDRSGLNEYVTGQLSISGRNGHTLSKFSK